MKTVRKMFPSAKDAASELEVPVTRLQRFLRDHGSRIWPLETSTSTRVKEGRKAELFVKEQQEFKILRDCCKTSARHPFDLVVQSYGAVDVKSTKLQTKHPKDYNEPQVFWSFTTKRVSKVTKYLFLVAYNNDRSKVLAIFIVPRKDAAGAQTIHVMANPVRGKWAKYLYKVYEDCDATRLEKD